MCQAWNTLIEETPRSVLPQGKTSSRLPSRTQAIDFVPLEGKDTASYHRFKSHIQEFDYVCGGGLVPGSVILIGGDPGIGKSTLLLHVMAALSSLYSCAYISGEEGTDQIRLRAHRLGVQAAPVQLAACMNLGSILDAIDRPNGPQVVVIDSIQTLYSDSLDSAPGTVAQVRACASELIRVAKMRDSIIFLVGHVTKEGVIAGPRVLEHMVDVVLYFEGDRGHTFRLLRTVKNRFGPSDEVGVFEMSSTGLQEVTNPSALFLSERQEDVQGSVVFASIEGTRPVLCEVQALVSSTQMTLPRRTVVGWDAGRLAMVIAVLEARCGVSIATKEVYLNVVGGLKITEPAADLAVAAALLSSISGVSMPRTSVIFGEIGLSGEVRSVSHREIRLKEASKLGFTQCFLPKRRSLRASSSTQQAMIPERLELCELANLKDLLHLFQIG